MTLPNYDWKNTVNLISSIQWYCWVKQTYKELDLLKSEELNKYDNVVLFLVDWLGYNWLQKYAPGSFLSKNIVWDITSVFPSTTSTAVTTFSTWYTASEHAIMWRNMFVKEASSIIQILPWRNKILKNNLWDKLKIEDITVEWNFFEKSDKEIFIVTSELFKEKSNYNNFYNKNSKVLYYNTLNSFFDETCNAVTMNKKKKYIYSYWWDFDWYCHDFWIDSKEAIDHFVDLDYQFQKLYKKLEWTNTLLIVTADHWQINTEESKKLDLLKLFPELDDMLVVPMAWEERFQYCYIKDWYKDKFKNYIKSNLSEYIEIFSRDEVLEMKLFWYWNNNKFLERIWDFLLIAKDNYTLFYNTLWEKLKEDIWFHWWLNDWEIKVPVICIR